MFSVNPATLATAAPVLEQQRTREYLNLFLIFALGVVVWRWVRREA